MRIVIEGCAVATVDGPAPSTPTGTSSSRTTDRRGRRRARPRGPRRRAGVDGAAASPRPGLVNTHHHLYQWATRGLGPAGDAVRLAHRAVPGLGRHRRRDRATPPPRPASPRSRSPAAHGTDHHYVFPRDGGDLLAAEIEAAARSACGSTRAAGRWTSAATNGGLPPDDVVEDRDAILAAREDAIDRFHDPSPGAMVRIALAPCSPFSVTARADARGGRAGPRRGVRLHTHLAETVEEEAFCLEQFGCRPVEYLERLGWLGDDVWLAHCVHLDDARGRPLRRDRHRRRALPELQRPARRGIAPVAAWSTPARRSGSASTAPPPTRPASSAASCARRCCVARLRGGPRGAHRPRGARAGHDRTAPAASAATTSSARSSRASSPTSRCGASTTLGHAGIEDPVAALVLGPRAARGHAAGRRRGSWSRTASCAPADERAVAARVARRRGGSRPRGSGGDEHDVTETGRDGGSARASARPDGMPKVKGEFAYSSDLWADGMLWGATLRSPHPRARIRGIDIGAALAVPGVHAVLTDEDVPGREDLRPGAPRPAGARHGPGPLPGRADRDRRRRPPRDRPPGRRRDRGGLRGARAARSTPRRALDPDAPPLHPGGQPAAHVHIRHGDPDGRPADVVVTGEYEVGMQDQAFLGPESGLAVPAEDGGVDLYIATQWLHVDRDQVAACLGPAAGEGAAHARPAWAARSAAARTSRCRSTRACSRCTPAGREDGLRPRGVVLRPRPPAPGADAVRARRHARRASSSTCGCRDPARRRRLRVVLDGRRAPTPPRSRSGPTRCPTRASTPTSSTPTTRRAARCAASARSRRASRTRRRWTSSPPRSGMDPVELRLRNAMADRARRCRPARRSTARRRSPSCSSASRDRRCRRDGTAALPGGIANITRGEGVRRGVGYAVGFKNVGFSEGFDDYSTARVRLSLGGGEPLVEVHTAAAEVGQGLVTVQAQIARTELGRRARARAAGRHAGRLGGLLVGVAPDVHDRRRGQGSPAGRCARSSTARAAAVARRADRRRPDRGHARAPPPRRRTRSTRTARATRT